MNQSELSC